MFFERAHVVHGRYVNVPYISRMRTTPTLSVPLTQLLVSMFNLVGCET